MAGIAPVVGAARSGCGAERALDIAGTWLWNADVRADSQGGFAAGVSRASCRTEAAAEQDGIAPWASVMPEDVLCVARYLAEGACNAMRFTIIWRRSRVGPHRQHRKDFGFMSFSVI